MEDVSLVYGSALLFISSALCSSAGVGGGSLNVPILYSIMGFDYDTAVILSLCALMGNYLLQVLVNLDKRHPSCPTKPLIYWDAVLILLPSELGGANIGVIASDAMPDTVIFTLAMIVLVIAVGFSLKKGLHLYKQETIALQEEAEWEDDSDVDDEEEVQSNQDMELDSHVDHDRYRNTVDTNSTSSPLLSSCPTSRDESLLGPCTIGSRGKGGRRKTRTKSPAAPPITISSIIPPYLCCYYSCFRVCGHAVPTRTHSVNLFAGMPRLSEDLHGNDENNDDNGNGYEKLRQEINPISTKNTIYRGEEGDIDSVNYCGENNNNGNEGNDDDDDSSEGDEAYIADADCVILPDMIVPWKVIHVVLGVWVIYVACYLIQQQFSQCSFANYICLGIIYILLFIQVHWGLHYVARKQRKKPHSVAEGDIDWAAQSTLMPLFALLIGITSALLGIGGGELMGPMMLLMKVLAPVSSATTSFMSLLNTSSSVVHFLIMGELPYGTGVIMFIIGAFGGVTGRVMALFFVARYKRASLLIFALIGVIASSIFIYLYYIIVSTPDLEPAAIC